MDNKAREINSPVIKQLLDETTPEELAKIDAEMTNNKQQTAVDIAELAFKLYPFSSDSVRNAFITGYNKAKEMECVLLCAKGQRSIKLPSDEEIKKMMEVDGMEFDEFDPYDVSYLGGATWMRDKIKGGEQ